MMRTVTVRDVIEVNDISGRKFINVVGMADDELVPVHYLLTPRYMIPHEKLMLATVSPEDEVQVEINELRDPFDLTIGEYIGNKFNAMDRVALCRCGNPITTDGNELFCSNRECGLTLLARIERLASCRFFSAEQWSFSLDGMSVDSGDFMEQPFALLLSPKIWNKPGWTIDRILLDKHIPKISMATFLVQDQFRDFIDACGSSIPSHAVEFVTLNKFYQMMDQVILRRDYDSVIQNLFIKNLLWSFSIPGLNEGIIEAMITAEHSLGIIDEPLLPYLNYLTNSTALQEDLGVDRLTADWISREFYIRRHEFFDIFTAYSLNSDVLDIFNNMNISKRNIEEIFKLHELRIE